MILDGGRVAPSHFLTGDVGHDFGSAKAISVGSSNSGVFKYQNASYNISNVVPGLIQTLNRSGAPTSTEKLTDVHGYFTSKGVFFGNHGDGYGPSQAMVDAASTNSLNGMNPMKAKVSGGQALLELIRGDIPRIFTRLSEALILIQRMKADGIRDASHAVGSAYLNNVFGWTPIIKDIEAALNVFMDIDKALFVSDDTRRTHWSELSLRSATVTGSVGVSCLPPLLSAIPSGTTPFITSIRSSGSARSGSGGVPAVYTATERVTLKTSARFHTGVRPSPANNGWWDRSQDLNRVFGTSITPALIWELTPWSWLIDWFFNIGSVIENLSTIGLTNTLLNYAYSTVRREASCQVHADPYSNPGVLSSGLVSFSGMNHTVRLDQKVRRAASPFGFGVSLDSLSGNQWAILVALGLARSR
jgi:hypothetical protein